VFSRFVYVDLLVLTSLLKLTEMASVGQDALCRYARWLDGPDSDTFSIRILTQTE
jgi:hypothetical protein